MKLEHIALWVNDLEASRAFYQKYFHMTSNEKYVNPQKKFESYFLSFPGSQTRIEIMTRPDIPKGSDNNESIGITHIAICLGSNTAVDTLTEQMREDGVPILSEPRTTGDGYYESIIADPDGNRIEITA